LPFNTIHILDRRDSDQTLFLLQFTHHIITMHYYPLLMVTIPLFLLMIIGKKTDLGNQ